MPSRLEAIGPRIAMDDSGAGYLSSLQGFPFDKLESDQSSVSNL
jgi:predicted signal transduction protein with EAL and GGDEF domain